MSPTLKIMLTDTLNTTSSAIVSVVSISRITRDLFSEYRDEIAFSTFLFVPLCMQSVASLDQRLEHSSRDLESGRSESRL